MALQPLLAVLVVASLGLTAYVSSVSREVRQIVQGGYSFAQMPPPPSGGSPPPPPSGGTQSPPPSGGAGGMPPPPGGQPGQQPGQQGPMGPPPGGGQPGQQAGQAGQFPGQGFGTGGQFPGQGQGTGGQFPGQGFGVGGQPGQQGGQGMQGKGMMGGGQQGGQMDGQGQMGGRGGMMGGQQGQQGQMGGQQGMQGKGMMGGQQGGFGGEGGSRGMMGSPGEGSKFPSFGAPPGGTPGMQPGGEGGKFPSFGPPPGGEGGKGFGGGFGGFGGGFGGLGGPPGGGQSGPGGEGGMGQGQPGMPGGAGQPGQHQSRFEFKGFEPPQGPQEGFESEGQEERFEKERARQEERALKDMQRGISQMEKRGPHKDAERVLAQIKKKFNCEPPGLTTAIASVTSAIESAKGATSFEEIQGTMESLPESMEAVHSATEGARALLGINLPKKGRIESALQGRLRNFGLTKGKITSAEKQLGLEAGALTGRLDEAKAALLAKVEAVTTAANSCDFEALQEQLDSTDPQEVFEVLDTELAQIAAIVNYIDFQKRATGRIKEVERLIRELKREKVDTTEATAQVAIFKEQVTTVKEVCSTKPVDVDACGEAAAEFEAALKSYRDGVQKYLNQIKASKKDVFKGTGLEGYFMPTPKIADEEAG